MVASSDEDEVEILDDEETEDDIPPVPRRRTRAHGPPSQVPEELQGGFLPTRRKLRSQDEEDDDSSSGSNNSSSGSNTSVEKIADQLEVKGPQRHKLKLQVLEDSSSDDDEEEDDSKPSAIPMSQKHTLVDDDEDDDEDADDDSVLDGEATPTNVPGQWPDGVEVDDVFGGTDYVFAMTNQDNAMTVQQTINKLQVAGVKTEPQAELALANLIAKDPVAAESSRRYMEQRQQQPPHDGFLSQHSQILGGPGAGSLAATSNGDSVLHQGALTQQIAMGEVGGATIDLGGSAMDGSNLVPNNVFGGGDDKTVNLTFPKGLDEVFLLGIFVV